MFHHFLKCVAVILFFIAAVLWFAVATAGLFYPVQAPDNAALWMIGAMVFFHQVRIIDLKRRR